MGGSCRNLGPQAISKTLRETILTLVALQVSVLPFWKFWSDIQERQTLSFSIRLCQRDTYNSQGRVASATLSSSVLQSPSFLQVPPTGTPRGPAALQTPGKDEAGDLQRKACGENACLSTNKPQKFRQSPYRHSLNGGAAAFPSLQRNSLVARAGTAQSAKQPKHQHLYSDCSDRSNPHAGRETGSKLRLITHVGHGPI